MRVIIPHASWSEPRLSTLSRLLESLNGLDDVTVLRSEKREHASTWARRVWLEVQRSAHHEPCVILNDDAVAHPELRTHCESLSALLPEDLVSLHCTYPKMKIAADHGARLARCYWPSGVGMMFTPEIARDLLAWVGTVPRDWFTDGASVNEDGAIASFLWSRQRPAYATIPALVRHDVATPSLLSYDNHPHRTAPTDWADYPAGGWTQRHVIDAPYIPIPWMRDADMQALGDSLRAVIPLCAMCHTLPAWIRNGVRNTGICRVCAGHVTHETMKAMLAQSGVKVGP